MKDWEAEDDVQKVADLLGTRVDSLGGGLVGFWFTNGDSELIFGYGCGGLGYSYEKPYGNIIHEEDLHNPDDYITPEMQAKLILNTLKKYGFNCELKLKIN